MEVIIRSGIIVTGLLFIRKLAMGKISRKFQYYMWGILPIVLLIFPYFRIPVPAFKENANQIRKAAQGVVLQIKRALDLQIILVGK